MTHHTIRLLLGTSLICAGALSAHAPALAAGFQVREQSAEGLGRAYSGEAVAAGTAAGLWFNPAQAARLDTQVTAGVSGILLSADLEDAGSSLTFPNGAVAPVGGPAGEDPVDFTLVPYGAAVWRLNDQWAVGGSFNAPFGLVVDYGEDYFGRFDSTESELVTIDVSGTVAYAPTPSTSIGASVHLQYVEADLTTALPDPLGRPGQGSTVLEGNNYALGWSVGVVQDVGTRLSLAASYRSEVEHEVDGSVITTGLQAPLDAANGRQVASTSITLPDSARLAAAFQASDTVRITAQAEWVGWSDFESLDVLLEDSGVVQSTPFDYRSRANYGVGVDWRASPALTLRAGVSADPTPTRDGERSTRVPDADRTWFTVGAGYDFGENTTANLGFAYIDADGVEVSTDSVAFAGTPLATGIATRGELSASAVVGAVSLTRRF